MIYQEQIFTKEECEKIIGYSKIYNNIDGYYPNDEHRIQKGNRVEHVTKFFTYDAFVIHNDNETRWIHDKMTNWFYEKTKIKFVKTVPLLLMHKYTIGDKFLPHFDLNDDPKYNDRVWNFGIQLNDDYDGGDYNVWEPSGNKVTFSKIQGNAVLYPATLLHEITEIKENERWSLVLNIVKEYIEKQKPKFI